MDAAASPDTQARVEQLLRDAHIQRMRQQWLAAESLCREALDLSPDDLMGQEMLADLLVQKGSVDEALALYRAAFEHQPDKASLEAKLARTVLLKDREENERLAAQLMLSAPVTRAQRKRNATVATLLAIMCPGAGQIWLGQYVKGWTLLIVGMVTLFFGFEDLTKMALVVLGAQLERGQSFNGTVAVFGLAGVVAWLYGLLDVAAQGGKSGKDSSDV